MEKKEDLKKVEMNIDELEKVNGGYYWPNTYPNNVYESMGIKVEDVIFGKDKFTLPDGTVTDMDGADTWAKAHYVIDKFKAGNNTVYNISPINN